MTTLESRLREDIKTAMKGGRKDELEVLRTLMADLKNAAIEAGGERTGLDDDLVLRVLRRGVKTRSESRDMYREAGRKDLEEREAFQIDVLERYLPAPMSEAEIEVIVDTVITELGAETKKDMGRVMKEVMARIGSAADGKLVSKAVGGRLA